MQQNVKEMRAWRLAVRDKKDWSKWKFGKEYESLEAAMIAAKDWLEANPGRVIQFQVRKYWVGQ